VDDDAFLGRIMPLERGIPEISSSPWLHLKWELHLRMPPTPKGISPTLNFFNVP